MIYRYIDTIIGIFLNYGTKKPHKIFLFNFYYKKGAGFFLKYFRCSF